VAKCAANFAAPFGWAEWAKLAGQLHDIGKASDAFLAYIRGKGPSPDHSTAGAVEALRKYGPQAGRLLAFAVAGHHAGLADGRDLTARLTKPLENYSGWETYAAPLLAPSVLIIPQTFSINQQHHGFSQAFLTRMIFSCLVDADFLETEKFYSEGRTLGRGHHHSIQDLSSRLEAFMAQKAQAAKDTALNRERTRILDHVRSHASDTPGLFTLTVPTGGGKTLASLSFALSHAALHGMRRVIYVAPYTSIIEQTAQVFREALQTDDDIVEHHGNFDFDEAMDRAGEADRDGIEKLRRATENWDAPVIVTTAVQFFESLFAARTGRCRKLHNIAKAVVILDEAQTLPLGLVRPCMAALDELARNYGVSIVLCTATQPAWRLIDTALPADKMKRPQGFNIGHERELAPDPETLFNSLKRVDVEVMDIPIDDSVIAARFAARDQMLCIVNTRGHAEALFDVIRAQPGAVHLSTLMYPAHRRAVLAQIKQDLKDGRPVRLVATSLVEAGVDFSFPEVWRAETGLDSIAQAAGRCNREGGPVRGRVVVFKPATLALPTTFRRFRDAAQGPLRMVDPLGLTAVRAYFQNLYFSRGYAALDTVEIDGRTGVMPAIDRTADHLDFPFAEIAQKFRMIDDVMRPVIIARDEPALQALAAMGGELPPHWALRRLQLYTVAIPQAAWQGLAAAGAIQCVNPKLGDRFMKLTAETLYDDATGLMPNDPTARSAEQNII